MRDRWNPRCKPKPSHEGCKHHDKEPGLYFEGNKDEVNNFKLEETRDQNYHLEQKLGCMEIC